MAGRTYWKPGERKGTTPNINSLANMNRHSVNDRGRGGTGILFWIGILIIVAGWILDLGSVVKVIGFILALVGAFV